MGPAPNKSRILGAVAAVTVTALTLGPIHVPAAQAAAGDILITRIAGNANGSTGTPTQGSALGSGLDYPYQIDRDSDGNLYYVDWASRRILKVDPDGDQTFYAGNGNTGAVQEGGATGTPFSAVQGLALDTNGNLIVADPGSRRLVKITPGGQLTYFAGNGTNNAFVPGLATSSPFGSPMSVAIDGSNNVYVTNSMPQVIIKISAAGTLSVFAGTGSSGANQPGLATDSPMAPYSVAADNAGNVYATDVASCNLLKITPAGTLSILAGDGSCGAPTAGSATGTSLGEVWGIDVDDAGNNVYLFDQDNYRVMKVSGGQLSFIAGTGTDASPTYGGLASTSPVRGGEGLVVSDTGTLYLSHSSNNTVDRVGPNTPSSPRDLQVQRQSGTLSLSFLPPTDPGTSVITGYESSIDEGATWQSLTVSPSGGRLTATIGGVPDNAGARVTVRALNALGSSPSSTMVTLAGPAGGGGLPITGDKVTAIAAVGVLLTVLGIGLVRSARRRRVDFQKR